MTFIHPTVELNKTAKIGLNTKIWHYSQIRENVVIGKNCIIGKNVYIDFGIKIGDNCKIQNNTCIYHGTTIENGVFIGPGCIITNDKNPRAINEDGSLKTNSDWKVGIVYIKKGSSIGAGSIILPGITIGQFAMIGAGSVVTKSVSDYTLVYGNPGRILGKVDKEGRLIQNNKK